MKWNVIWALVRSPSSISHFFFFNSSARPLLLFVSSSNSKWPACYCSLPLISITAPLLKNNRNFDCRAFNFLPSNLGWVQHYTQTHDKHAVYYIHAWKPFYSEHILNSPWRCKCYLSNSNGKLWTSTGYCKKSPVAQGKRENSLANTKTFMTFGHPG